jgi:hypothetical protein
MQMSAVMKAPMALVLGCGRAANTRAEDKRPIMTAGSCGTSRFARTT